MADLVTLTTTIPRATFNRLDIDLATIFVMVPYVDVNGVVSGVMLEAEAKISDPRFTSTQKTQLKNGIKMIGTVLGITA